MKKEKKNKIKKEWSPDKYLAAAAKKIWRWSPEYKVVKTATKCIKCGNDFPMFTACSKCKRPSAKLCKACKTAKRKCVPQADHIEPVVNPKTGFVSWDEFFDRLFKGALQPLCWNCHQIKTQAENVERRKVRKQNG